MKPSFGSDNFAGAHPEILAAITAANSAHERAYGDDPFTARAVARFRELLGPEVEVFFVFNGTAANVLGLQAMMRPYEAVLCAQTAHINNDECGAPERHTGGKLLPIPTPDGKLTPELVAAHYGNVGDPHHVQPRVISISQSTELGTVYTPAEVRALADWAHARGLYLHMDGARLANAAASLGVSPRALTAEAGVDALSFGGTKNGLLFGEAVVFFRKDLARDFQFIRKQGMQLASKMRFIAAQFEALLSNELWLRNARHANRLARMLAARLERVPGVSLTQPVQANGLFPRLPRAVIEELHRTRYFYVWAEDPVAPVARLMLSWDSTEADVDEFASALESLTARA